MLGPQDWLISARKALQEGDLLAAFDAATNGLADGESTGLRYLQVLALARMGELQRAKSIYDEYLHAAADEIDIQSLGARLAKDRALRTDSLARPERLRAASEAYADIFRRTQDTFPGINAASLSYLAGDRPEAATLAESVLSLERDKPLAGYFDAVTVAEALLLLGREAEAATSVEHAMTLPGCDHGARSSTSRQFRALLEAGAPARALIKRLQPPPVMTFCGHLFLNDPKREQRVRDAVARALDDTGIRYGYGALACGVDIVVAETLLARGGELHVVLPFRVPDFVRACVVVGGDAWTARFERCLEQAREVVIASEASAVGDPRQFEYAALLSMGYARLRAGHLGTSAVQLAVWDERDDEASPGPAADVRLWHRHGGETIVVAFDRPNAAEPSRRAAPHPLTLDRAVRAMIFADFAGFSKIDEAAIPEFWRTIMGAAATLIERHAAKICSRNSWGDALFIVLEDVASAALLALDLQAALADRLGEFGAGAGMRVSAHIGAVYEADDPITGAKTFYGHEVNKAARIEPITSVGEIYVSRAFAAVLEMQMPATFDLSYVGRVALAKDFGTMAMYRLSRLDRTR